MKLTIVGLALMTVLILAPADSHAATSAEACPAVPIFPGWHTSNQKIVSYVERKYKGDWSQYVTKWESYARKMAAVQKKGGTVVIKSRKLKLSGERLDDYVDRVQKRLVVHRCLSEAAAVPSEEMAVDSGERAYACRAIPEVPWWGDLDHQSIINLVREQHSGKWKPYLASLDAEFKTLMSRFESGKTVTMRINSLGFDLEGEEIALYVVQLTELIAAASCLAAETSKQG